MPAPTLLILPLGAGALWLLWACCAHALLQGPRPDPVTGLAWWAARLYAAWFHRCRYEGLEHVPRGRHPGPLVLVVNHTAGVDPVLVQAACPFFVRWMMGRDMRTRYLRDIWVWIDIIDVDRKGRDTTSARAAVKVLRAGGVIGIFPEGRIERPRGELLPFHPGVGMIVQAGNAQVLPVFIRGTPDTRTAWGSLAVRGNAVVRFGPAMHPPRADAQATTALIRAWFEAQHAAPR
ncbi:MAG: lysophospholipid acyltransferase family protein [Phycisphaerales bacterium]